MNQCVIRAFLRTSLLASVVPAMAQVPGIPEPPVVIYGTVTDSGTDQPVTVTGVVWQVTDGADSAIFNAVSSPPARIVTQEGKSFYLLEVPFETRSVQNGPGRTITLNRNGESLELKSSGAPCTLTPFINGQAAEIHYMEGVETGGGSLPLTNSPAANGRMLRVDLKVSAAAAYTEWAAQHFTDPAAPEAAATADPDGDGVSNDFERQAGTNPKDPASVFRLISLTPAESEAAFTLTWHSIPEKIYRVESSATLSTGQWKTETTLTATESTTTCRIPNGLENSTLFYRIAVIN